MPGCAEELFQVIVGMWQIFHLVTCKEAIPIAGGDFLEMRYRRGKCSEQVLLLCHGGQELLIVSFQRVHLVLLGIGEQMGRLMYPRIGLLDGRPQFLCRRQSGSHKPLETAEIVGEPLFSATRLIESSMAWSRSLSFNPSASRGGRPSSVSALLTARQYPRTASASSSIRPSKARSSGRTPRTCFLSVFLACRSASAIGLAASRR